VNATLNELAAAKDKAGDAFKRAFQTLDTSTKDLEILRLQKRIAEDVHDREVSAIGERQRARIAEATPVPAKVTKRRGK
jgi:flagellar biosynthesis regulator FlbT